MPYIIRVGFKLKGGGFDVSKLQALAEDESVYGEMELATGVTDSSISFGPVTTADILYIESDQQITFRQAAADTGSPIDANRFMLLFGTSATAVLLSNASGSTANVKYLIGGV